MVLAGVRPRAGTRRCVTPGAARSPSCVRVGITQVRTLASEATRADSRGARVTREMTDQAAAPPRTPVGVLVVDEQIVFRDAVRDVIEAAGQFVLVGEASSGEHAVAAVAELHPDLVLVDVRMGGMDGIETARRLTRVDPDAVVVLVTTENPLNLPAEVGFCGAADLVRKQDLRPALLRRLWRAHGSRKR